MKAPRLLRIASVLSFIHAVLHTFGGLLKAPSHGPQEIAVLNTMKSFQFDFMGSRRTYWDFYLGFGLFVTLALLVEAVLLWQLASLVASEPTRARPLIASLFAAFVGAIVLSWGFFFVAPLITSLIAMAYTVSKRATLA